MSVLCDRHRTTPGVLTIAQICLFRSRWFALCLALLQTIELWGHCCSLDHRGLGFRMDWFFQFSGLLQLRGNEKGIQSKRIQRFDKEQKKKPACCIKNIQTEGQNLKKEINSFNKLTANLECKFQNPSRFSLCFLKQGQKQSAENSEEEGIDYRMLRLFTRHRGHTGKTSQHGMVPHPQQLVTATTHHLVFHAGENDVQHLSQGSLGGGLIDEIFAGQVDIVTCPDCLQDSALMNFNVRGCDRSEKSLKQKSKTLIFGSTHCPSSHSPTFFTRFAFVFIWFGLRRWLCELNWIISTKSQVPAAPSSKKFKHTY